MLVSYNSTLLYKDLVIIMLLGMLSRLLLCNCCPNVIKYLQGDTIYSNVNLQIMIANQYSKFLKKDVIKIVIQKHI